MARSIDSKMGAASKLWCHHALNNLNKELNGMLGFFHGCAFEVLSKLCDIYNVEAIHWNRSYEPWRNKSDNKIRSALSSRGINVFIHNGSLLWEPWEIKKPDGNPYKVFTPYYKKCCQIENTPRSPNNSMQPIKFFPLPSFSLSLDELNYTENKHWETRLTRQWDISEKGAVETLSLFLDEKIKNYTDDRDFPAKKNVSYLSPYLHFGMISPHQVWHSVNEAGDSRSFECFCRQLAWREFSYSQLYYHPELPQKNLRSKFDNFPWRTDNKMLGAWKCGKTGIPMVDAGMRELYQTGHMHNRVRMIAGSFLVKNCLLDWRLGEKWFWECLFDADLASNSAGWQWVAGCGFDAAPYFRIFNPVLQGRKFDPDGCYIREFCPELSDLPLKYIHAPWEASDEILHSSSVILGESYPKPIVDLKQTRERALKALKSI